MVQTLVTFGGRTDATVVAEGLEDEASLALVGELGVEYGQGWHLGKHNRSATSSHASTPSPRHRAAGNRQDRRYRLRPLPATVQSWRADAAAGGYPPADLRVPFRGQRDGRTMEGMLTEVVPTVQRVYEAAQDLLATQPDNARGVTASQIAADTGLALPTVLAAFELLAFGSIVRVAQPGDPAAVTAVPVRQQPPRGRP
jgi:hypothetical protein